MNPVAAVYGGWISQVLLGVEVVAWILALGGGVCLAIAALGLRYLTRAKSDPSVAWEGPDDRVAMGIVAVVLLIVGLALVASASWLWWWLR